MLNKNAQSVLDALDRKGIETKVLELPSSTRTAEDAAKTIGCQVAEIVKSLIFRTRKTHKPILVLASGINRVNEKAIAAHIGEEIEKADAAFTKEVTGFTIGGIPPIGHKQAILTFIDKDLMKYETIWAAAGTPNAVFCLKSFILPDLTGGQLIQIS